MIKSFDKDFIIGMAIFVASLGSFFWWGVHFEVFESKIEIDQRPLEQGGFFFWILSIAFGAGFMAGGIRRGSAYALRLAILLLLAFGIGYLRGNY